MRAVLDPAVLVSAVLSRSGTPAELLRAWIDGAYELVVSPTLMDELARVMTYPKIRARVTAIESEELLDLLRRHAEIVDDARVASAVSSTDPDDDYLIGLGSEARAMIVSGDSDLLSLADRIPVFSPAEFLDRIID